MKKDYLTSQFMALRSKLHRSALAFLKNDEDAKDVVQDTFINLWNKETMKSETEIRNKLFVVLRNLCIDRIRRNKLVSFTDINREVSEINQPPDEYDERFEKSLTNGLSEIQRKIYDLVVYDGIEYEVIAERLGTSVESVRMNMSRARKKIRNNYKILNR